MGNQNENRSASQRKTLEEFKSAGKTPAIIVIDNIRSALNIGSIFRTADAFLVEAIYICGISATPPNREMEKTALGATQSVDWRYFQDTLSAVTTLKESGYLLFGVEQTSNSKMLNKMDFSTKAPSAFVFGNEVNGVSQEVINLCDAIVEIPQSGTKHSLNVSVSAGIVMWEAYKQLHGK